MEGAALLELITSELEVGAQGIEKCFDSETGNVIYVSEDDRVHLDKPDSEDSPEWEREHLKELREVLNTDRLTKLPDSFDINEWSIMERFCGTVGDRRIHARLVDAIQGRGAFARFRDTLGQFGLRDVWFAYRRSQLEEIAREWLEDNNISSK